MQFTNNLCTFFEMQFTAKLRWMWFCESPPLRIRRPGEEIGQIWRREGEAILYRCISPSHGPVRRYIFFLNLINLGFLLKKKPTCEHTIYSSISITCFAVIGRSFVLHAENAGGARVACADIMPMDGMTMQMTFPVMSNFNK